MQNKFCRICYNTAGWQYPTGAATDGPNSYFAEHGFGHEEWLFNYDWLIGGFRYGFLQPIGKFLSRYSGHNCSILLYTRTPDGEILLIGQINDARIPNVDERREVLTRYEDMRWLNQMRADVVNIEGNAEVLADPQPDAITNIRFLPENAIIFDPRQRVVGDHVITRNLRYHPFNWRNDNYPAVRL